MGKCPIPLLGRGGWVDGGDPWEAGVRVVEGCGFCVAHFFRCMYCSGVNCLWEWRGVEWRGRETYIYGKPSIMDDHEVTRPSFAV